MHKFTLVLSEEPIWITVWEFTANYNFMLIPLCKMNNFLEKLTWALASWHLLTCLCVRASLGELIYGFIIVMF